MIIKGGQPDLESSSGIAAASNSVMCPVCEVIWQLAVIQATFSEEEKERFWSGKGCPDCRYLWQDQPGRSLVTKPASRLY